LFSKQPDPFLIFNRRFGQEVFIFLRLADPDLADLNRPGNGRKIAIKTKEKKGRFFMNRN